MILHTVNKSPSANSTFKECLFSASAGDQVLLIEDGVYAATNAFSNLLRDDLSYYVLQEDMAARGLNATLTSEHWQAVDYAGFVALTETADSVCSWF
ncbi:MAG: sulfurtransferase complex subunit TusB [Oceanospirillum sp.]|nr:sulfurtransferase complex subunit TusB [Oceanospirillum sp.]MDX1397704.1 sulfurtransferase complex subunit TusB [Oceanospirillum sp.]